VKYSMCVFVCVCVVVVVSLVVAAHQGMLSLESKAEPDISRVRVAAYIQCRRLTISLSLTIVVRDMYFTLPVVHISIFY